MRIKQIMREKGMLAKDLAVACGITPMAVSNIVTGKSYPNYTTIIRMAEALGVKCGELFDDYEPIPQTDHSELSVIINGVKYEPVKEDAESEK